MGFMKPKVQAPPPPPPPPPAPVVPSPALVKGRTQEEERTRLRLEGRKKRPTLLQISGMTTDDQLQYKTLLKGD